MEIIKFDFSALAGYYNARINYNLAGTVNTAQASATADATARAGASDDLPWRREIDTDKALIKALGAASFLPDSVAKNARSEKGDVPKILAAYEALAKLKVIADAALDKSLPVGQEDRALKRILSGMGEVRSFLGSVDIEKSTLIAGERVSVAESEVAIQRSTYEYGTKTLHDGDYDAEVAAFTGDKSFSITVNKINTTQTINIDLADMEATTGETVRNLDNVAAFINTKLEEAGVTTRFQRVKIGEKNEDGIVEGNEFGFKIKGTSTEKLSFASADAAPAAVMVGQSGLSDNSGGQISVWSGLDGAEPTRDAASFLGSDKAATGFSSLAKHPDGGYVVAGTTSGTVGDGVTRGETDAFIARYDSQGKMLWSRTLGAGSSAEGLALAVSDTGQIALTGKTDDELTSTAIGGGEDTFVTLFDSDGIEQWTRQRASTFDDQGNAIAFASDGSIVVAGQTSASMTDSELVGGNDSFIEKLDADGNQVWIRQFGTTENDSVKSLAMADDGSVIAVGIENGEAVVRRFASDVDDAGDWSYSLGNLQGGDISDVKIASDGSVYVSGATRADGTDANGFTTGSQLDRDGFVAKISPNGASPSLDWISRIGGDGYQSVTGIEINGDQIVAVGTGEGQFGTGTSDKDQSAFMTTLAQADGTQGWTSSLSGRGGIASASDILITTDHSATLNAFGLPDGEMVIADTASLTDRLSMRAGDHFYLSVDGGREKKITIEQGDSLRSLSFRINAALVLDGNADVRRGTDGQKLKITPKEGVQINLRAGTGGQDALSALGLLEGTVMAKPIPGRSDRQNDAPEIVTMGLTDKISFDDKDSIQDVVDMLDGALRGLRTSYRWAIDDPTLAQLKSGEGPGKKGGAPPAYLTAQIANLQAGLQRLTGGNSGFNVFA